MHVLPCYDNVGLRITEAAHCMQQQVSRFITDFGFVNSYDTWHGEHTVQTSVFVSVTGP